MILLFSYFLFLWNSQNFLQLKMDFICIITSFDCLMKNNSMQTLMLNCPFKIFLLSRLCWSVLSFIYHLPLLSQSLPSLHATFQRERKNERHFYSYPHLLPGSPFLCMVSLIPKIPYLESLKWGGEEKAYFSGKCGRYAKKLFIFFVAVGSAEVYLGLASQNEYGTRTSKIHSKAKLQKLWEMWIYKSMKEPWRHWVE